MKLSFDFSKSTLLAIAVSCDYFLFVTGNPSVIYILFGGWFEIPLIGSLCFFAAYVVRSLRTNARKILYLNISAMGALIAILVSLSDAAIDFSETRIRNKVMSFIEHPLSNEVNASSSDRELMQHILTQDHSVHWDGFIPTFRRGDCVIASQNYKFRLVATVVWPERVTVSLREVQRGS